GQLSSLYPPPARGEFTFGPAISPLREKTGTPTDRLKEFWPAGRDRVLCFVPRDRLRGPGHAVRSTRNSRMANQSSFRADDVPGSQSVGRIEWQWRRRRRSELQTGHQNHLFGRERA